MNSVYLHDIVSTKVERTINTGNIDIGRVCVQTRYIFTDNKENRTEVTIYTPLQTLPSIEKEA
jgi:hypothetical protein